MKYPYYVILKKMSTFKWKNKILILNENERYLKKKIIQWGKCKILFFMKKGYFLKKNIKWGIFKVFWTKVRYLWNWKVNLNFNLASILGLGA